LAIARRLIVLDTHAWLWWLSEPNRLSRSARAAIDEAGVIGICTLSAWEITMLCARKRIELDREVGIWVRQALAVSRVQALAPTAEISVAAGLLDSQSFPGDPIDRLIYSTAHSHSAALVTRDTGIRAFDPRRTIW
jgi:PIN domain nuclease of toxin-antitoxin system